MFAWILRTSWPKMEALGVKRWEGTCNADSQPNSFLPCCMECRRGLAMRILSVRPSVIRVHCDKTEEKSVNLRKIILPSFLRRRMVGGGRSLLPEILGQQAPVGTKSPILNRNSLVSHQP